MAKANCSILAVALLAAVVFAAEPSKDHPSTPDEWRQLFEGELLDPKAKVSRPETDRVKLLIFLSLSICQMIELTAALQLQSDHKKAKAEFDRARNCASEGVTALKKQLPKARQELAKVPRAVEKLNSYAAAYLSAMAPIPRVERSERTLEMIQQEDLRKVQDKKSELEVELL